MEIVESFFGGVVVEATPNDYVPSKGRAAWLEKHGKPVPLRVKMSAPPTLWEAAGVSLDADGAPNTWDGWGPGRSLDKAGSTYDGAHSKPGVGALLADAAVELLRKDPADADLDVSPLLVTHAAKLKAAKEERDRKAAEQKAAAARQEAELHAQILATQADDVMTEDGSWKKGVEYPHWAIHWTVRADDEVSDHVAAIRAERQRRTKAAAEAKAAIEREYEASVRAYAVEHYDDLARAAKEGYDIKAQVIDRIAHAIGGDGCRVYRHGTKAWDAFEIEDRKAPRADAFRALDELEARVKATPLPTHTTTDLDRIKRFRETDEHMWSTALLVYLSTPSEEFAIVVPVEPFGRRRDDEEEEE